MKKYPEEFIQRAKAEYPNATEFHAALDNAEARVGKYLDESRDFNMTIEQIVAAFNEGRSEEVKETAERAIRRQNLYREWTKIAKTMFHSGS